ncbi:MAG TPA: hypothetical protein VMZ28_13065 [Kofleriaceae bacterium]|nr:hypothetical protein [Kofleriaceae bacterium]
MPGRDPERTIVLHLVLTTAQRGDIEDELERLVYDLGTLVILHEMEGFDHYFRSRYDPESFGRIADLLRAARAPNLDPLLRMHELVGQLVPSRAPEAVDACFRVLDDDLYAAVERWGDQFHERIDLMWKHVDRHLRDHHAAVLKVW